MSTNKKLIWIFGVVFLLAVGYVWQMQPSVPSNPKPEQVDFLSITREIDNIREQITNNAKNAKSIKGAGVGVPNTVGNRATKISRLWVHEDGVILVQAKDFGAGHSDDVLLLLIPKFSAADIAIKWECIGYPREVVPNNCR
jgi:hypothetical protein